MNLSDEYLAGYAAAKEGADPLTANPYIADSKRIEFWRGWDRFVYEQDQSRPSAFDVWQGIRNVPEMPRGSK
jgi:hypothetical protein